MNNKNIILTVCIILLIAAFGIYKVIKKRIDNNEAIWGIVVLIGFVTMLLYIALPMFFQCDADGNIYTPFSKQSMWECATYYTINGEAYHVENDYLIHQNNPNLKYKFEQSYLNKEGFLLFDEKDEYIEIKDGVFVDSHNEHVYSLYSGYWNIFGKFKTSEAKGIRIGNDYIVPFQENLFDYDLGFNLLTLLTLLEYSPMILFICSMLKTFTYFWRSLLKIEKMPKNISYLHVKYSTIYMVPMLQLLYNEMIMTSFLSSFIWVSVSTLVIYYFIPYEEGDTNRILAIEDENKAWYEGRMTYPLKVMRQTTNEENARKWQRQYLIVIGISYISWIMISVLISWRMMYGA